MSRVFAPKSIAPIPSLSVLNSRLPIFGSLSFLGVWQVDSGLALMVKIAVGIVVVAAVSRGLRLWRMQRMARAYVYLAALGKGRSCEQANREAAAITINMAVLAADEVESFVQNAFAEDEGLMLKTAREKGLTH